MYTVQQTLLCDFVVLFFHGIVEMPTRCGIERVAKAGSPPMQRTVEGGARQVEGSIGR